MMDFKHVPRGGAVLVVWGLGFRVLGLGLEKGNKGLRETAVLQLWVFFDSTDSAYNRFCSLSLSLSPQTASLVNQHSRQ